MVGYSRLSRKGRGTPGMQYSWAIANEVVLTGYSEIRVPAETREAFRRPDVRSVVLSRAKLLLQQAAQATLHFVGQFAPIRSEIEDIERHLSFGVDDGDLDIAPKLRQ